MGGIDWLACEGGELWSVGDRFSVLPCPNGWYGYDHSSRDCSRVFRTRDEAREWCQDKASASFDGTYAGASRVASLVNPMPPGATA